MTELGLAGDGWSLVRLVCNSCLHESGNLGHVFLQVSALVGSVPVEANEHAIPRYT